MTWKLTAWAKTRLPVTGVPWRDLSDEEFAAASAEFAGGALAPYFEYVDDAAAAREAEPHEPAAARRRRSRG